ncbi:hypothetical protein L3X38_011984 [Prunus dulcis]|uniref:GRF-type domain-containing protein n=1 Tax=Prunus dulcis TaxID=3755 RepID=A0AAD4ZET7_PRUDU|nr:hypothetical protein L3X38_011984 [Prunus dulcis]
MSESSTNSTRSNRYCFCGMKIKRRASWTDLNPERRFEACDQNRNSQTRHLFFKWLDNETCPRGKEVLPGLLRRLRGLLNVPLLIAALLNVPPLIAVLLNVPHLAKPLAKPLTIVLGKPLPTPPAN